MMQLTIIAFGKIKESYWQKAADEYLKRLKPYSKIIIEELKALSFNQNNKEEIKNKEGIQLIKYLMNKNFSQVYLLTEKGEKFDTLSFAEKFIKDNENLCIVVGPTLGFSREVLNRYKQVSLSPLTFTHELAQVILLEQLYRALTIKKGKNYHY